MEALFCDKDSIPVRALFIGQRLELKVLEKGKRLASTPLVVTVGADGCAVLFRYGVAVLFGLTSVEEAAFLESIKPFIITPHVGYESEDINIVVSSEQNEDIVAGELFLKKVTIEHLQVIADILAKSVVLAFYEASVAKNFDRIEPFADKLRSEGSGGPQGRDFVRHIGDTLIIQSKMVGRVEVADKPEVLWEFPQLERLFLLLEDEYEIKERHIALERKLELIARTAETSLELLQNKRSLRVEWYIVILIVVDIVVSLLEKF
ncbi:RMD1 family protein [Kaarinaea lacus]